MSLAHDPRGPGLSPCHVRAAEPPPGPAQSFEEKMRTRRGMDALTPDLRARLRAADGRRFNLLALAGRGAPLLTG